MTLPVVVLLVASGVWVIALRGRRALLAGNLLSSEFWWAFVLLAVGIINPLTGILGMSGDSSDASVAIRLLPLLLAGGFMVLTSVRRGLRVSLSGGLLVFIFGILAVQYLATPSLISFLSFLLFLPAILSPIDGYDLKALIQGCRAGIAVGLVAICAAAVLSPAVLVGPCRLDKCSLWGQALGPYGTGNALGMVVALAGAVSLISAGRWSSFVLVAASSAVIVDLTSSRSALYSWLFCALIAAAFHVSMRARRRVYVSLAAIAMASMTVSFTFFDWSASDFTERGSLWAYARQLIASNPWFGYGSSFWVRGETVGGVPLNYSTHNWFLEMLVSIGIVGVVALLGAMISSSISRFGFLAGLYATSLAGFVFAMSTTEVFSAPGRTYLMSGLAVLAFVVSESRLRDSEDFSAPKVKTWAQMEYLSPS